MKFKVIFFFIGICCLFGYIKIQPHSKLKEKRVYWLIPDGFRAEPTTMKIYEWAQKGLLPNILWMMKNGSYGYSIPVFPGHTPSNTASLVTGTYPSIHGVSDGGMRTVGYPIAMANKNGYSSVTKKVPPIWYTLEERGKKVEIGRASCRERVCVPV